jgi:hypothetical protein
MSRTTAAVCGVLILAACGSSAKTTTDGGASVAIGAACIPSQELSTTFLGFDDREVAVDEGNVACGTGVCLVNHYRGRVTCPYGQNPAATSAGLAPMGTNEPCKGTKPGDQNSACCTPGSDRPVLASQDVGSAMPTQSEVLSACIDRPAAKTVTCSCRCANAAGKTDDGAQYCSCPGGFACTQLVPELTVGDPLAGAYCIANGTAYDPLSSCASAAGCDPTTTTGQPSYCGPTNASGMGAPADAGAEATYFVTAIQNTGDGGVTSNAQVCWPLDLGLPTGAGGMTTCVALVSLPAGESCSGTPGLTATDPAVVASVHQALPTVMFQTLCNVPQLAAPCATGTPPGWCYVTGTNAPQGCESAIDFTTGFPPTGSLVIVGCY